ncbi:MAG: hypothetical protein HY350_04320 [Candidatus Omnitrophica bacterium]|nr:hypothetical protein [Candidatus Omnitrophota bacterium]
MDSLKRFKETVYFGKPDRVFLWPQWIFDETKKRWQSEGLPKDAHFNSYFDFDRVEIAPVNLNFIPAPESRVIEEDNETATYVDDIGNKWKQWKNKEIGMSQWIDFGLRNESDWGKYKKMLNSKSGIRYPEYWEDWKRSVKGRDYPLGIHAGSFYGWFRNWVGVENLSVMFYDNPQFVKMVIDYIADFVCETLVRAVEEVRFDFAVIWEDLAMKNGPLLSPALFKEFCMPATKKVTGLLRRYGIDVIMVDSDGNNDVIIPLWLESGVNGIYPLEVAADSDAVKLRKEYDKKLILMGNIDKRELTKTKKDIDNEVMKKVPYLAKSGGYISILDHAAPPDIPLENFQYYLDLIKKVSS